MKIKKLKKIKNQNFIYNVIRKNRNFDKKCCSKNIKNKKKKKDFYIRYHQKKQKNFDFV